MESINTQPEFDRPSAMLIGVSGAAAFLGGGSFAYFCPVGNVETDTNKSDKPSIMRVVELIPA